MRNDISVISKAVRLQRIWIALAVVAAAALVEAAPKPLTGPVLESSKAPADFKMPVSVKRSAPVYPLELQRAGLTARVILEFVVDKEGMVRNPHVVSSNNPWFERSAIDALLRWRFKPGEAEGRPVNVRAVQQLDFLLPGTGPEEGLWRPGTKRPAASAPPEFQWHTPPVPVNSAFPVYPFAALRADKEGKSRVTFVIDPRGRVVRTDIAEGSKPEFAAAVRAMLDTWTFTPAKQKDGTPCYAAVAMEHDFNRSQFSDAPVSDSAKRILRQLEKNPGGIAKVSELDAPPKPLSRRPPKYPSALGASRQEGSAVVEFFIDEEGDAQLPAVVSSTEPEFGYAAVQAIATWRFEPALKKGKPVVTRVRIPVEFKP